MIIYFSVHNQLIRTLFQRGIKEGAQQVYQEEGGGGLSEVPKLYHVRLRANVREGVNKTPIFIDLY